MYVADSDNVWDWHKIGNLCSAKKSLAAIGNVILVKSMPTLSFSDKFFHEMLWENMLQRYTLSLENMRIPLNQRYPHWNNCILIQAPISILHCWSVSKAVKHVQEISNKLHCYTFCWQMYFYLWCICMLTIVSLLYL